VAAECDDDRVRAHPYSIGNDAAYAARLDIQFLDLRG
jgi:hypothetical protein